MVDASVDFKRLPTLTIPSLSMTLPMDPNVVHGTLPCGLQYYIKQNQKPEARTALQLAVRAGSVLEKEHERGIAHMIEHLGFRATANYPDFLLIKFLESVGASFGACQNAYTSFDETVFQLNVPTDKAGRIRQSIGVLHEWATRIRISAEDLEGERGVVLEELRQQRNSTGRLTEAYWQQLTLGSKYELRMPIGIEEVIRQVEPEALRSFYRRHYRPSAMCAVIVGDFASAEEILKMLADEFSSEASLPPGAEGAALLSPPPLLYVPPHTRPRCVCLEDPEATGSEVSIECKHPRVEQAAS